MSYAYVIAKGNSPERAVEALETHAWPVLQVRF
jgi:hypothetical protein